MLGPPLLILLGLPLGCGPCGLRAKLAVCSICGDLFSCCSAGSKLEWNTLTKFPEAMVLIGLLVSPGGLPAAEGGPDSPSRVALHDLELASAPASWHLGLPLANGELGTMVWGTGDPLILTLDRYDVWESRTWDPDPLKYNYDRWRKLIEEGRAGEIREEFQVRHWAARARGDVPSPTRLPLGRLEIRLGGGIRVRHARLDLTRAEARLSCVSQEASADGHAGETGSAEDPGVQGGETRTPIRVLVHATRPVIAVEIRGPAAAGAEWTLVPARLRDDEARRLERLGYKPPDAIPPAAEEMCHECITAGECTAAHTAQQTKR